MDLEILIVYIVGTSVLAMFMVNCWHKLLNIKIDFKNYKIYLGVILATLGSTIVNFYLPQFLKIFLVILILFVLCYWLFRNVEKAFLTVVVSEFIAMICELILVVITFTFIESNPDNVNHNLLGMLVINLGVPVLAFLSLKTPIPYKIYGVLYKLAGNLKSNNLVLNFVITVILASLFMVMTYIDLPPIVILTCNTILIILYVFVILRLSNVRENYRKVSNKYATSLSSLREHETMMDKYRVTNHENKNQLLIIRNMIKSEDKTTINYIDKLIDNKSKDNEGIFKKTEKIPEGGLRSIIYSKLCKMKEMKIKYALEISRDVKTSDLINLDDGTMLNICKIMGVFLDNSIEEVEKLKKQIITVELYNMDGYLCIDISNNYSGNLAVDKIGNKGYTTKGKGHGYGLSLVDEIIRGDSSLENEKEICRDMFTQRLKIKM
ncbi:MAG: GHKL domain-containing protein [Bacilli bacterium]|nr:GHKL domain-containing protein [Bacilli bacterium]